MMVMSRTAAIQDVKTNFANRLRQLMDENNLTQGHAATLAGVTQGNITKYLQAVTVPRIDVIVALHENLGVNPNWLLLGIEPKYITKRNQPKPIRSRVMYRDHRMVRSIKEEVEALAITNPCCLKQAYEFMIALNET